LLNLSASRIKSPKRKKSILGILVQLAKNRNSPLGLFCKNRFLLLLTSKSTFFGGLTLNDLTRIHLFSIKKMTKALQIGNEER